MALSSICHDYHPIILYNWHRDKKDDIKLENKENVIYTNLSFEDFAEKGLKKYYENINIHD